MGWTIAGAARALLALALISINTLVHIVPLLLLVVPKLVLPLAPVQRACRKALAVVAESWIGVNSWMLHHLGRTEVTLEGSAELDHAGHYLVLANHQSWVDIVILQRVFNRRIPLLRFFLKKQLFWVPVLGVAWWALDFPFMHRHSRAQIARRPELAGRDIAATRRACERFRGIPVAIMNFVEGTRFTPARHQAQQSPWPHLLRPRAGGIAFVLAAMGEVLDSILDVTILYPHGRPGMGDLLAGRVPAVQVHLRQRPIPGRFLGGDYQNDPEFRARFQSWLNGIWDDKEAVLAGGSPARRVQPEQGP